MKTLRQILLKEIKYYIPKKDVPTGIIKWAKSILRKDIKNYVVIQGEIPNITQPWHEGDINYW